MEKPKVTAYEVTGEINYEDIVKDFGLSYIDEKLKKKLESKMGDNLFLRRGIFFVHRDLDFLMKEYEKGNMFYLYTGRGPSGETHLGHLIPYIFTKQIQDAFGAKLLYQLTDDEKFLFRQDLTIEETNKFAYENALDFIAMGFDPEKTEIFTDTDYAKTIYRNAIRIAKKITFSTVKAVFGLKNESNIGQIFFTSVQAVPAMLESERQGKNVPCLIPHAVDQDPHFRIARDVLPKLGYYKPSSIQCKFIPGLAEGGKMSASDPKSAIFVTDSEKQIRKKVMGAFTGGKPTVEEQKEEGGNPDICPVYQYYYFLFENNDSKLKERFEACKNGKLMCGECKKQLSDRVVLFMHEHQKKREDAKKHLDKFIVKD